MIITMLDIQALALLLQRTPMTPAETRFAQMLIEALIELVPDPPAEPKTPDGETT